MSDGLTWSNIGNLPTVDTTWGASSRVPQNDLDRNAFLQLLITQLRHQDPLNPMEDRDFIAQMAQFSALEQMVNLNATMERTQAFGMVGKIINADFFHEEREEWMEIEQALVVSVRRVGDHVFLTVVGEGGNLVDVPFHSVYEVTEDFFISQQLQDIFIQLHGQRATDMIGRYVQAFIRSGEDGLEFVEGKVDSVKLGAGGQAILVVGTREIFFPHEVHNVSREQLLLGSTHWHESHGRVLTNVIVRGTRAYLIFDNDYREASRVHIQRVNQATEALAFVGERISHSSITGTVETVQIVAGIPFLNVRRDDGTMARINFIQFLEDRAAGNLPIGGGAPPVSPPEEEDGDEDDYEDAPPVTDPPESGTNPEE